MVLCTEPFTAVCQMILTRQNAEDILLIVLPHPQADQSKTELAESLSRLSNQINSYITAGMDWPFKGNEPQQQFVNRTTFSISSEDQFYEIASQEGWTDGLPVIAPTHERVSAFQETYPINPEEEIALLPPSGQAVTIHGLAVNAIMAGCAPTYLPVLLAAIKALSNPEFCLDLIQVTTSPAAPVFVINGPIVQKLNINFGSNALGPGRRANAVIGRALRLVLQNIGGARPGLIDMSTLGQPGKYSFCFAEDEKSSPWQPLSESLGVAKGESAVTVFPSAGFCEVRDSESTSADDLIHTFANTMTMTGIVGPSGTEVIAGVATLVICPEHARLLAKDYPTRAELQERLWQESKLPACRLSRANRIALQAARQTKGLEPDFDSLPITKDPSRILILVAGGPGRKSVFIPGWGPSQASVSRISTTL